MYFHFTYRVDCGGERMLLNALNEKFNIQKKSYRELYCSTYQEDAISGEESIS